MKIIDKNTHQHAHPDEKREIAEELKVAFDTLSPFIEKHTAIVCPECNNVCCIDKHGRYDENDIFFMNALDMDINSNLYDRQGTAPCRFIAEKGCTLERWMRPFRCTHFFCGPLLKSLENDNAKVYRTFTDFLQYLISVRKRLLDISSP